MQGILNKLKPGQAGGGFQQRGGTSSRIPGVDAKRPRTRQPSFGDSGSLSSALDQQRGKLAGASKASQVQLPDWIRTGEHVGYLSRTTGKLGEVIIEKVSRADGLVKIVFAEDRNVWKAIPFEMIVSSANPLRQLAAPPGSSSSSALEKRRSFDTTATGTLERKRSFDSTAAATGSLEKRRSFDATPKAPQAEVLPTKRPRSMGLKEGELSAVRQAPSVVPLVGTVGAKAIPDSAITATSYFMNSPHHGLGQMWRSRIDNKEKAWRPASDTGSSQGDLEFEVAIDKTDGSKYKINIDEHEFGLKIKKVGSGGLVDKWNTQQSASAKKVQTGDIIVSINGVSTPDGMKKEMSEDKMSQMKFRRPGQVVTQCIRWDLGSAMRVAKIWTKGSNVEDHWVTEYKLSHSVDGVSWTQLDNVFEANQDRDTLAENSLEPPVMARHLRLQPLKWHQHVGLRVELFGPPPNNAEVAEENDANSDSEEGVAIVESD